MDSSVSPKSEIWFLHVCHHISNAVYITVDTLEAGPFCVSSWPYVSVAQHTQSQRAQTGNDDPAEPIECRWIKVMPCMKLVNNTVNQPVSSSFLVFYVCRHDRHFIAPAWRISMLIPGVLQIEALDFSRFWGTLLNYRMSLLF